MNQLKLIKEAITNTNKEFFPLVKSFLLFFAGLVIFIAAIILFGLGLFYLFSRLLPFTLVLILTAMIVFFVLVYCMTIFDKVLDLQTEYKRNDLKKRKEFWETMNR